MSRHTSMWSKKRVQADAPLVLPGVDARPNSALLNPAVPVAGVATHGNTNHQEEGGASIILAITSSHTSVRNACIMAIDSSPATVAPPSRSVDLDSAVLTITSLAKSKANPAMFLTRTRCVKALTLLCDALSTMSPNDRVMIGELDGIRKFVSSVAPLCSNEQQILFRRFERFFAAPVASTNIAPKPMIVIPSSRESTGTTMKDVPRISRDPVAVPPLSVASTASALVISEQTPPATAASNDVNLDELFDVLECEGGPVVRASVGSARSNTSVRATPIPLPVAPYHPQLSLPTRHLSLPVSIEHRSMMPQLSTSCAISSLPLLDELGLMSASAPASGSSTAPHAVTRTAATLPSTIAPLFDTSVFSSDGRAKLVDTATAAALADLSAHCGSTFFRSQLDLLDGFYDAPIRRREEVLIAVDIGKVLVECPLLATLPLAHSLAKLIDLIDFLSVRQVDQIARLVIPLVQSRCAPSCVLHVISRIASHGQRHADHAPYRLCILRYSRVVIPFIIELLRHEDVSVACQALGICYVLCRLDQRDDLLNAGLLSLDHMARFLASKEELYRDLLEAIHETGGCDRIQPNHISAAVQLLCHTCRDGEGFTRAYAAGLLSGVVTPFLDSESDMIDWPDIIDALCHYRPSIANSVSIQFAHAMLPIIQRRLECEAEESTNSESALLSILLKDGRHNMWRGLCHCVDHRGLSCLEWIRTYVERVTGISVGSNVDEEFIPAQSMGFSFDASDDSEKVHRLCRARFPHNRSCEEKERTSLLPMKMHDVTHSLGYVVPVAASSPMQPRRYQREFLKLEWHSGRAKITAAPGKFAAAVQVIKYQCVEEKPKTLNDGKTRMQIRCPR